MPYVLICDPEITYSIFDDGEESSHDEWRQISEIRSDIIIEMPIQRRTAATDVCTP